MRAILFLIGGIVLANIVTATFFWRTPKRKASRSRSSTRRR